MINSGAKELLEPFWGDHDIEYLPCKTEGGIFYLLNITRLIEDSIMEEASEFEKSDGRIINQLTNLVFYFESVEGKHLFKIFLIMVSIIIAIANNGIIGGDNNLLWHIREDLQRFKRITTGHPVIMGRKTFESLGKPLPNRTNVVITRQKDYQHEGCIVVHSLDEAIELFPIKEEIFIIGGGEIYKQAWDKADKLYITWIIAEYIGDTSVPEGYIKKLPALAKYYSDERLPDWRNNSKKNSEWEIIFKEEHEQGEKFEYPFVFVDYRRIQKDQELLFPPIGL